MVSNLFNKSELFFESSIDEVHPSYLSDDCNNYYVMGAIIDSDKKQKMLPFIKQNFGRLSQREMARRLNIGKTTVNSWSKELGLLVIKNSVDEDYFKEWSSEMAYILGYIFADGNISWNPEKSYRALTITAAEKDKNQLEMVREELQSTKVLLYADKTKSYRLIANSVELCKDLMKLGLTPKKSLTVKFPHVPDKFLRHFIRGVIDGDGNVRYVERERSPYFAIAISSGSNEFLEKLAEKIYKNGIKGKVRKHAKNVQILQYTCQRGMKLAEWIYQDADLFMDRKYQQYKKALNAGGGDVS